MIRYVTYAGPDRWPRHPVLRTLAMIGAGIAFVLAAMLGAMLFLAALALVAVLALVLTGRMWWLRRKYRAAFDRQAKAWHTVDDRVIDGDFRVIDPDGRPRR